jgi:hypothetical protein
MVTTKIDVVPRGMRQWGPDPFGRSFDFGLTMAAICPERPLSGTCQKSPLLAGTSRSLSLETGRSVLFRPPMTALFTSDRLQSTQLGRPKERGLGGGFVIGRDGNPIGR